MDQEHIVDKFLEPDPNAAPIAATATTPSPPLSPRKQSIYQSMQPLATTTVIYDQTGIPNE
jgi:hypothetical protein